MTPKEIISELLTLERDKTPISLLNVYKGLPVTYPVTIIASFQGRLLLKTNRYQIACLKLENKAFIRNNNNSVVYQAEVEKINFNRRQVILKNFSYADPMIGKREQVRVQVLQKMDVVIDQGDGSPIRSKLFDLSVTGIAVDIQNGDLVVNKGASVKTALQLPEISQVYTQRLVFTGMIETVRQIDDNTRRVGISTNPDSDAQELLEQYIEVVQAQYLGELQDIFHQELEKETI